MSAGKPDYIKLAEMGKLPQEQRGNIPNLVQIDLLEAQIKKFKEESCEKCRAHIFPGEDILIVVAPVSVPEAVPEIVPEAVVNDPNPEDAAGSETMLHCEVEGCGRRLVGRTEGAARYNLRLHMKSHGQ
jgi:hypothetical protein